MKFQVKGTELHSILGTVIKGFNSKEDNSYIAFKLDVGNGKLIVTSRSRSTFFQGSLSAHSIELEDGEPTVYHLDGVKLRQLVTILPTAPVNVAFEINDKTRSFTIKTMVSKYKLPVLSETPLVPSPEVLNYATVDANDFMAAAKDLIRIVSTDAANQEHQVSCMHFNLGEDKMKMSATDSYTLGSIAIDSNKDDLEGSKDILIRHSEVSTLLRTFSQGETITIVGSDEMFGYIDEDGTLSLVGIINMTPLDTSRVEESTESDNTFTIDKNELKSAIETVSKLSPNDETVDLLLEEGREEIRVSNRYGDYIDILPSKTHFTSPGKASFATSIIVKGINPANNGPLRLEFGNLQDGTPGATRIVSLQADGSNDDRISLIATRMVN